MLSLFGNNCHPNSRENNSNGVVHLVRDSNKVELPVQDAVALF